jgi:hypothetical protein
MYDRFCEGSPRSTQSRPFASAVIGPKKLPRLRLDLEFATPSKPSAGS